MPKIIVEDFSVGLVDDQPIVREGLANVIGSIPRARIGFSCATPHEAWDRFQQEPVDVLLLDLCLAQEDDLAWLKRFGHTSNEVKVLMLTVSGEERAVFSAIKHGACGYLLKDSECEQIVTAIECARHDVASISPADLLPSIFRQKKPPHPPSICPQAATLSTRERQILRLVVGGANNKVIARKLALAESTVKKYCYHAMTKLSCRSREAAAMAALRLGLIELGND